MNSKWIKDLNVSQNNKTLTRKRGHKSPDIEIGNGFSDMTPRAKATRENIDKLDFFKIKKSGLQRIPSGKGKDNLRTEGEVDTQRFPVLSCTLVNDGLEGGHENLTSDMIYNSLIQNRVRLRNSAGYYGAEGCFTPGSSAGLHHV